jgi:3-dehydroquinate synthase
LHRITIRNLGRLIKMPFSKNREDMKTIQQSFSVAYRFPVIFTRDVFGDRNTVLADMLAGSGEKQNLVLIVADSNVVSSNPGLLEAIERYGQRHRHVLEFVDSPFIIRGGEICKTEPLEVEKIRSLTEKHHICRHSFILVIGGGAVLDAAGYAAATAHRGIRLIRMPTTTLAQNDAGVGVKNGVNAFGKKNYIGTFAPPYGVINDFDFLDSLPARDMRAGIAEAVKVALIKDRPFFDYLYSERHKLRLFEPEAVENMTVRCAELHMEHMSQGGDPFEAGASRPLDFGHWSAHNIEELTSGSVRHGEAVAMGIALDSLYSHHLGKVSELELKKIFLTLEDIGFDLYHWAMGWVDVDRALKGFQEHLGGELTVTLLDGIGRKTDVHEVDTALMRRCIETLAARKKQKETNDGCTLQPDECEGNT